jgi:hypothetical protein
MQPQPHTPAESVATIRSEAASRRRRAQCVLFTFLATFIAARVLTFLIMSRKIPDLFLHVGGTHIHHLNYGIAMLVGVGAWLLFRPPSHLRWPSILYGIGLALTFDEFGMWLHLGGGYWQRASWDAVVVISAALSLFAFGPSLARYRSGHWTVAGSVMIGMALFFWMLVKSLDHAGNHMLPRLQQVEESSPP